MNGANNKPFFKSCDGCTRYVLLIGKLAFKFPQYHYGWSLFLKGLLGNMQERIWWRNMPRPELCPIVWGMPGGWLLVMKRAEPLTDEEFRAIDMDMWSDRGDWVVPGERKVDSYGWLDGRLVGVDYGD